MDRKSPLLTINDMLPYVKYIRNRKQEYVICLSLDSADRLIARRVVTIGTLTSSLIHPREVFAAPLKDHAASVVIAHNHPSGSLVPTRGDISVTHQLVAAGQILGIVFRDHLIVASDGEYSFRKAGFLEWP